MQCMDYECSYRTLYGNCSITACIKPVRTETVVLNNVDDKQILIFPHTIGDITFYSKGQLIDWVITQQRWNKDPNFGRGIGVKTTLLKQKMEVKNEKISFKLVIWNG